MKNRIKKERTVKEGAKICVLCGEPFTEFGNNPWPLATLDDGQCCNECNETRVIPARIIRPVIESN